MADDNSKSWWTTVPGILTGSASLVVAVGGLIVALHQSGLIGERAEKPQLKQNSPISKSDAAPSTEKPKDVPPASEKPKGLDLACLDAALGVEKFRLTHALNCSPDYAEIGETLEKKFYWMAPWQFYIRDVTIRSTVNPEGKAGFTPLVRVYDSNHVNSSVRTNLWCIVTPGGSGIQVIIEGHIARELPEQSVLEHERVCTR